MDNDSTLKKATFGPLTLQYSETDGWWLWVDGGDKKGGIHLDVHENHILWAALSNVINQKEQNNG